MRAGVRDRKVSIAFLAVLPSDACHRFEESDGLRGIV